MDTFLYNFLPKSKKRLMIQLRFKNSFFLQFLSVLTLIYDIVIHFMHCIWLWSGYLDKYCTAGWSSLTSQIQRVGVFHFNEISILQWNIIK